MRPSPEESATLFNIGTKKKGGDGKYWMVSCASNDVKKWIPADTFPTIKYKGYKAYNIHHNGNFPYVVYVKGNDVHIYKRSFAYDDEVKDASFGNFPRNQYVIHIKSYKVKNVFIGKGNSDSEDGPVPGNTVLLQVSKNKYIFVGGIIYEFEADDIVAYHSQIMGNDIPYPVALSKNNVYFLLDKVYIPIDKFGKFNDWASAYNYYYTTKNFKNKAIKFQEITTIDTD
jgi:hypothetical protein